MATVKKLSRLEETFALELRHLHIAFEREYKFHPKRKWRFDFALPALKVGIEIEGGIGGSSRHTSFTGFTNDCEKYNAAAFRGWRVLRYTAWQTKNVAAQQILELIEREGHGSQETRHQEEVRS